MDEETRCKPDAEGWCRTHPICELNKPEVEILSLLKKEGEKAKTLLPPPDTQMEVCRGLHEHIKNIAEGTIGSCSGEYKTIVKSIIEKFKDLKKEALGALEIAVERGVFLFELEQEILTLKPVKLSEDEILQLVTKVVRQADQEFESTGGSSRHWVRDWFLPLLRREGFMLMKVKEEEPAQ